MSMTAPHHARPALHNVDRALAVAAHDLDDQAEAALRSIPALSRLIDAELVGLTHRATTRGPRQLLLRRLARTRFQATPPVQRARDLHQHADGIYWSMVTNHDRLIHRSAARNAVKWSVEVDDALSRLWVSWFEAAVRYDPAADLSFAQWGSLSESANVADGGPPLPLIHYPKAVTARRDLVYLGEIGETDDEGLSVWPEIPTDDEPVDDLLDDVWNRARMLAALDVLGERERFVISERYLTGKAPTLREVGRDLGLSGERTRQIEGTALSKIREALGVERVLLTEVYDPPE
jgi:RNA polymerase sigma factor (sigma-70 family)